MSFSIFDRAREGTDLPLLPLHVPPPTVEHEPSATSSVAQRNLHFTMISPNLPQTQALLVLSREDAYLQAHLQALLDAQSEGLLAGLGAAPPDSGSSAGSRTPTMHTSENGHESFSRARNVVPVRQPRERKISLRGARRGIAKTIEDLARLKGLEGKALQDEIARRRTVLSEIQRISNKTSGLQRQIETIESEPTNTRISDLKWTQKALDREIRELETRLYEMKAHQRHLLREIQSLENGVQSKLSSYRNALQLAETEAREFLENPPLGDDTNKTTGIWALPPQRRTLELARDQHQEEQEMLGRQVEDVMREKEALDNGKTAWDEVLRDVDEVEKLLQEEMRKTENRGGGRQAREGMKRILGRMRQAKDRVGNHLHSAEKRNWKLLVCCIGAELEALNEGEVILQRAFEALGGEMVSQGNSQQLSGEAEASARGISAGSAERSEDEDEGPGPELLVSQGDI
ncbi:MAG: hypothetical protein Q9163_002081 [Psora crenata]